VANIHRASNRHSNTGDASRIRHVPNRTHSQNGQRTRADPRSRLHERVQRPRCRETQVSIRREERSGLRRLQKHGYLKTNLDFPRSR
jgi:hypothetical protein